MSAAKAAYCALMKGCPSTAYSSVSVASTAEEAQLPAKRAKYYPQPVKEQQVKEKISIHSKAVVCSCNLRED
ncbi:hypothetical protein CASFOL_012137 [Castilleja foliolosa]|uniref:Uncharacterized protein n=1 Tax=Castilleja foliolosa TaxID=1961234 RepID=A0ABD3DPH2_9LAMI